MGFKAWGLTYDNPNFGNFADSCGAVGHRVGSAEELPALLGRRLDTGGVHLVEVPVDSSDNDWILNREIRDLSAGLTL